ncbi:HlyD family efflux transporter periplasmic adaptor subunit [Plantactinospora solaniradicis]|uniref:HlyD family efflux transporter periplasmic adaptor subunit n=1 Tax=Plantactinospora solaniradicis TaxID=1723736 RepID=A0ABW1K0S8_9ACTN
MTGVVVVAGALVAGYALTATPKEPEAVTDVPTTTAPVTRGTVSQRTRLSGTYGFDGSYSVIHHGDPGIVTSVASDGSRIGRNGVLYRVDGVAVHLLFGKVPAYRDLRRGMSDGADVQQLESNLRTLGMDPDKEMTVDRTFSAATAAAVKRLQKSWGLSSSKRTGSLPLGSVVFLPNTARVSKANASAGATVGPGQVVLATTSTTRVVSADITADRQNSVKAGDEVTVSLPGATEVKGKVLRVGRVATIAESNSSDPATVEVVMGVSVPKNAPDLDQSPVQVTLASAERRDVLIMPISALLTSPGTGYRVRLADGSYQNVEPGLFDDSTGMVEVSGGVKEGDQVEVPEG